MIMLLSSPSRKQQKPQIFIRSGNKNLKLLRINEQVNKSSQKILPCALTGDKMNPNGLKANK